MKDDICANNIKWNWYTLCVFQNKISYQSPCPVNTKSRKTQRNKKKKTKWMRPHWKIWTILPYINTFHYVVNLLLFVYYKSCDLVHKSDRIKGSFSLFNSFLCVAIYTLTQQRYLFGKIKPRKSKWNIEKKNISFYLFIMYEMNCFECNGAVITSFNKLDIIKWKSIWGTQLCCNNNC